MWAYILTFILGMVVGGAMTIVLYALLIANDEDSSRGHPL